jgi:hypothetical protein
MHKSDALLMMIGQFAANHECEIGRWPGRS